MPLKQKESIATQPSKAPQLAAANAPPQPSTNGTAKSTGPAATAAAAAAASIPGTGVNKKKQKRREKEAKKAAAKASLANGNGTAQHGYPTSSYDDVNLAAGQYDDDGADDVYSDGEDNVGYDSDAHFHPSDRVDYGQKKMNKRKASVPVSQYAHAPPPSSRAYPQRQPTISTEALRTVQRKTLASASIWDTNSTQERAAIKEFWMGLSEVQRKELVNIEKGHVLQKMKEQQKHSCSCSVCGRKRTAIEEELELLLQDPRIWADPTLEPPPNRLLPSDRNYQSSVHHSGRSEQGRIQELPSDQEEEDDDGESAEDDDEEGRYSDDDYSDDLSYMNDPSDDAETGVATNQFFKFGNSLTIKDGVLSVADDLLKNDGQKFIDMMEHLAEKRMARDEEVKYQHSHYAPPSNLPPLHSHSHPGQLPPDAYDDPEDEEEDEDEEYDSQEGYAEDAESDDIDHLNENQRMEEGRRMFQIFAARMFEQRVVQAYKEKVATDRQNALIAAEESQNAETHSEAKKAKAAEKKKRQREKAKEVKAQKEALKEEERSRKEAALREIEEKKKEEQRAKQEEARKRKEAEREALAEKKRRKEAEAQKRIEAERERQQEHERKQREQKAEEKRKREEAERKKREEKESREQEARERKAQEERDKRAAKENHPMPSTAPKQHDLPDRSADAIKRPSLPAVVALPPSLQSRPSMTESPQLKIATPALPKPPTPSKSREPPSVHSSTPQTPERLPHSALSSSPRSSASATTQPPGLAHPGGPIPSSHAAFQPSMRPLQPPPGMMPHPGTSNLGMSMPGVHGQNGQDGRQSMMHSMPRQMGPPPHLQAYGGLPGPPGRPYMQPTLPPGMALQTRTNHAEMMNFNQQQMPGTTPLNNPATFSTPQMPMSGHSRQTSSHVDSPPSDVNPVAPPAPIGSKSKAPAPITRPATNKPVQRKGAPSSVDVDDLSHHLGSKALLADDDVLEELPPAPRAHMNRQSGAAPGLTPSLSTAFPGSPFDQNASPLQSGMRSHSIDGWQSAAFGSTSANRSWNSPGGWGNAPGFGQAAQPQARPARNATLDSARLFAAQAYRVLASRGAGIEGYLDPSDMIRHAVESSNSVLGSRQPISAEDVQRSFLLPGDNMNGGGTFQTQVMEGRHLIKWVPEMEPIIHPRHGVGGLGLGSIGSPVADGRLPGLAGLGRF